SIQSIASTMRAHTRRRTAGGRSPNVQHNNKRVNYSLTIDGRTQTLTEWAREANIHPNAVGKRIRSGWYSDWLLVPFPGMLFWRGDLDRDRQNFRGRLVGQRARSGRAPQSRDPEANICGRANALGRWRAPRLESGRGDQRRGAAVGRIGEVLGRGVDLSLSVL